MFRTPFPPVNEEVSINKGIINPIQITQTTETESIDDGETSLSSVSTNSLMEENVDIFTKIVNKFDCNVISDEVHNYSTQLLDDFNESLTQNSEMSMLPNFNINPTGKEHGDFLIIDLGGSTLRIAIIRIAPQTSEEELPDERAKRIDIIIENKWIIADSFKIIDYDFFKFIGSKIVDTISQQSLIKADDLIIDTGISWSFPLEQTSHNSGNIVYVGKGYTIAPEIMHNDLKTILETTLHEHFNVNIDIKVIINDSLAVFAAGSFLDNDLKLALVLGTGFNLCCSLNSAKMHQQKKISDALLVNSEMSLFGSNLLTLANEFDHVIDNRFSRQPFKSHMIVDDLTGTIFQPSELLTSGRYLPELTRLSLVHLISSRAIFKQIDNFDDIMNNKYEGFNGELMCFISETNDNDLIAEKLASNYGWDQSKIENEDIDKLKTLIDAIIKRASFIVAITIVAFIKLLQEHNDDQFKSKKLIIGYVGSVLFYFNRYRNLALKFINEDEYISNLGITVQFKSIDNSSIVGAAIGAAYYK